MKPLVIYHANCTDGFTAAWCFHHANPNGYDFHPASYGKEPPDVAGRDVILVDFSYPREVLMRMAESAKSILVLDHHWTASADLATVSEDASVIAGLCPIVVLFDMKRSGAGLAWDYLFPCEPRPRFLGFVEDRDLWTFKFPETKASHALLGSVPRTFEVWDQVMLGSPVEQANALAQGAALLRMIEKQVADAVGSSRRTMTIAGVEVPVANVPGFLASDAGHVLGEDAPFAATYFDTDQRRCFSLRSRPEGADVSAIAKQYGGGGHKNAAGFSVPRDHELARV